MFPAVVRHHSSHHPQMSLLEAIGLTYSCAAGMLMQRYLCLHPLHQILPCTCFMSPFYGSLQAVEDALAAGVDRFDAGDRVRVRSTQQALRMDVATAKDILEDVSRRAFLGFVSRARSKTGGQAGQQHAPAKELKGMVFFSNVCVAPLLEDIKVGWGLACPAWGVHVLDAVA